jgi:hypothetical protein
VSDLEDAGEPELNAAAIVEVLNRHQVRYVIIGAFAAIAQQAARRTCACCRCSTVTNPPAARPNNRRNAGSRRTCGLTQPCMSLSFARWAVAASADITVELGKQLVCAGSLDIGALEGGNSDGARRACRRWHVDGG